ncbi:MAG: ribonuclease T [Candidatus Andeanibacterium colombiense]|uniref:Ribonuclease T n=1 Tax=Candidatus Andeanibacterium colombiense TaxID=3121345 RepID=A0AAJ5X0M5_9SPHN|nr:MAG: ribonuclease T [Sphingomonadaceae bacterium]
MLGLPLIAIGTIAQAQAYQCRPPAGPVSAAKPIPDGPVRRTRIAAYTLALSWSPEHCRFATAADRFQCSGRNGRFGLVLHGLWPEGKGANWPQWCPSARGPSPDLLRRTMCLTPSADLIAHEWAKHGACMAKTPTGYFKAARILFDSLSLPDLDRLSRRKPLDAGMIRESVSAAFPAFKPEMVGIKLNAGGWLDEIRFCYNTDFRPSRCSRSQYGAKDTLSARIWRGL